MQPNKRFVTSLRIGTTLVGLVLLCSPVLGQETQIKPLTQSQMTQMMTIKKDAENKAAPAAIKLASLTKRIYENMLAEQPDDDLRTRLSAEMRDTVWELLQIKGQSIRDAVGVLTPIQKEQLKMEMSKPGAPSDLTELIGRMFMSTSPETTGQK